MITRQQVDQLMQFRNGEFLVTSCYLNLDRAKMPPQMLKIRIKDLLQAAQRKLSDKAASHDQRESLRKDFEQIDAFVMDEILMKRHQAVAIFACHAHRFWQAYGMPRMVRNILVADQDPYLRPLTAILGQYQRYGTLVLDRVQGQLYEIYMGQIDQLAEVVDEVPRRVRDAGLGGRDERHMERRHDQAVQKHYQHVAEITRDMLESHHLDALVLSGNREVLREFKNFLHPELRRRWAGDLYLDPGQATPPEILQQTRALEQQTEQRQQQQLVEDLLARIDAGNLAVQGISATVAAVASGEAQTLLVDQDFEMPGYACFQCHYPLLENEPCPQCQQPTAPCADIVDEVIELAMQRSCDVAQLEGSTPLREAGRIGALLRYQA